MRSDNKIKAKFLTYGLIIGISFTGMFYEARNYVQVKAENVELKREIENLKSNHAGAVKASPDEIPADVEGEDKISSLPPAREIKTDILPRIHRLESSGGVNDSCKELGLVNGYGFGIYKGHLRCYKSKAEVEADVEKWFEEKLAVHDLPTTLCGYNLGFRHKNLKDCINQSPEYPYYKNFLALNI